MQVVIFSGGNAQDGFFVQYAISHADFFIAADSGAEKALHFGITPHMLVGDFDSLPKKYVKSLQGKNVKILSSFQEKDETDTELAVQTAIAKGATQISIVGGTEENRLDHVFANVSLTRFSQTIPTYFINGNQKVWIEKGPKKSAISGNKNDLLSLIPLTEIVTNIQTEGLMYPLCNEPLLLGKSKGVSNVFAKEEVFVSFKQGILVFVHTAS